LDAFFRGRLLEFYEPRLDCAIQVNGRWLSVGARGRRAPLRPLEAGSIKDEYLGKRLLQLAAQYRTIGDVRGRGLMWGVELVDPDRPADALDERAGAPELARELKRFCFAHGLIVETGGRHGAVLRLLLPRTVSIAELDKALDVITAGLSALALDQGESSPSAMARLIA
jgi:hypothetical protein